MWHELMATPEVERMSLEVECCYRRLLDVVWIEGKISKNRDDIRAHLKHMSARTFRRIWPKLAPLFVENNDGYYSAQIDKLRANNGQVIDKLRANNGDSRALARPLARDLRAPRNPTCAPRATDVFREQNELVTEMQVRLTESQARQSDLEQTAAAVFGNGHERDEPSKEFETFWSCYPRKIGKRQAWRSWKKLRPSKTKQEVILSAVEAAKQSREWAKDNGRYVPNPATWLNQGRWDDELHYGREPQKELLEPVVAPLERGSGELTDEEQQEYDRLKARHRENQRE